MILQHTHMHIVKHFKQYVCPRKVMVEIQSLIYQPNFLATIEVPNEIKNERKTERIRAPRAFALLRQNKFGFVVILSRFLTIGVSKLQRFRHRRSLVVHLQLLGSAEKMTLFSARV